MAYLDERKPVFVVSFEMFSWYPACSLEEFNKMILEQVDNYKNHYKDNNIDSFTLELDTATDYGGCSSSIKVNLYGVESESQWACRIEQERRYKINLEKAAKKKDQDIKDAEIKMQNMMKDPEYVKFLELKKKFQ